jgi:hypothetical protein
VHRNNVVDFDRLAAKLILLPRPACPNSHLVSATSGGDRFPPVQKKTWQRIQ